MVATLPINSELSKLHVGFSLFSFTTSSSCSQNRQCRKLHDGPHSIADRVFLGYGGLLVTPKTLFIFLFSSQVVNLMSVDLLRQQPRWKEALVSLREIMTSLVQQVNTFGYRRFAPVASPCLWLNLH